MICLAGIGVGVTVGALLATFAIFSLLVMNR